MALFPSRRKAIGAKGDTQTHFPLQQKPKSPTAETFWGKKNLFELKVEVRNEWLKSVSLPKTFKMIKTFNIWTRNTRMKSVVEKTKRKAQNWSCIGMLGDGKEELRRRRSGRTRVGGSNRAPGVIDAQSPLAVTGEGVRGGVPTHSRGLIGAARNENLKAEKTSFSPR